MTTNSSARDGARGSDFVDRLIRWAATGEYVEPETPTLKISRQAADDVIDELRRHLCKCGHWQRQHVVAESMLKHRLVCGSHDGCYDFQPEESE